MTPYPDANTATTDTPVGDALASLHRAVGHHLETETLVARLVKEWQELSFDDRRYLGTSFPAIVAVLIDLENLQ